MWLHEIRTYQVRPDFQQELKHKFRNDAEGCRWAYQTAITSDAVTATDDHGERPSEDIGSAVSDLIRNQVTMVVPQRADQ